MRGSDTREGCRLKLEREDFDWFRDIIRRETGINIREGKYNFLYNRLLKRLKKLEMGSFIEYRQYLKTVEGREKELARLINSIVTPESSFFRHRPHMDIFSSEILPLWSENKLSRGEEINIISAGCARGEEPYSLAILACENLSGAERLRFKITAVDISSELLSQAEEAQYPGDKVKQVPSRFNSYFIKEGENYRLPKMVTRMVNFQKFNMIKDNWNLLAPVDLIMCRNTTIYFDKRTRNEIYSHMVRSLVEEGYLVMGPTEMVEAAPYGLEHIGHSVYRKV